MKYGLLLACALLANVNLASAEVVSAPLPDRHIQTTIERQAYTIAVDADIYGETIDSAQAYRVTTLDWGENPEDAFDLALWFDETVPLAKKNYDSIAFFPQGEEDQILWRDEARFSPYAITFQRATHARLEFPFERLAVEGHHRIGGRAAAGGVLLSAGGAGDQPDSRCAGCDDPARTGFRLLHDAE